VNSKHHGTLLKLHVNLADDVAFSGSQAAFPADVPE